MEKTRQESPPRKDGNGKNERGSTYGTPKKDMGGYIGERATAGDHDDPESLPGGA